MATVTKTWLFWAVMAPLALILAACSGGSSHSDAPLDPSAAYRGVSTPAAVSPANAELLAMGGFGGGRVASSTGTASATGKSVLTTAGNDRRVRQLAQVVKRSARQMEVRRVAATRIKNAGVSGSARTLARVVDYQIVGDGGGSATYTLDVNDATGSFSGSVCYYDYTSQGLTISGNAEVMGTFDANYQDFTRLTVSMNAVTVRDGSLTLTMVGTLSWGFNYSAGSDVLTMNMVLIDQGTSKTYWFNNYELVTTYGGGYQTQTLSGRYYDPDQGYVDFVTETPLVINYGYSWPSQGGVKYAGKLGSWIRLSFQPRQLLLEADSDGAGAVDWQAERLTNDQLSANLPPIAAAGADRTVAQGTTVLLDAGASSDPDGDPLSYSWAIVSAPQSVFPGLGGANSGTPSFVAERPGAYLLRLTVFDGQASATDTVTVTVTPAVPSNPALMQQQWQYGTYGTYIGRAGLLVSDLDGDGTLETVASASAAGFGPNSLWYVVRRAADGSYEQVWRSENYPVTIVRLVLADLTGDGRDDVIVGLADGTIRIYDGPTLREVRRIATVASLTALAVADLDGDGNREIVVSNGLGVFVYAAASGALRWSTASGGGSSLAVGNVDADPALEIVTATYGGKGYVIDGISRTVEWEYVNGFGAQVGLGDLDGDGMLEIVGASAWYKITVFDADRRTPVWEIASDLDIDTLLVTDADGDGVPEIVYGDGQWGGIHAINPRNRAEKWEVHNPDAGVSGVAFGDVDRNGKPELLWGAGGSSTGADHLYVANLATGTIAWRSMHIDGPLNALDVGDVDDDGEDEIVMVSFSSDSDYAEGVIHIFNARTHALEYREKLGIMDWMGVRSVKIGDVDNDGHTEFVVTTGNIYDGVIRVYNGATHLLKAQSAGYDGNFFSALAVGDVDNDGRTEIVAGQGREHTGATGVYLIVFDGATLQEKWRSVDLGSYWNGVYAIRLADVDGDNKPEIIASIAGRLWVFDGVSHDLQLLIEHPARALEVADVDGDGARELLVGRQDGKIDVFDGRTFVVKNSVLTFGTTSVDALRVADLDGDGTSEWLVAGGGVLTVLGSQGQGLQWRSGDLSGNLGLYNQLAARDTDGDGRREVFLGANLAIYQFE